MKVFIDKTLNIYKAMLKIGDHLLQQQLLTQEQIDNILRLQEPQNIQKRFGQWCIDLQLLSEVQLYQALAVIWGYEYSDEIDYCNNNHNDNTFYHYELQELKLQSGISRQTKSMLFKVVTPSTYQKIQEIQKAQKNQDEITSSIMNFNSNINNANNANNVDLFEFLISIATKENASDVHLEPFVDFAFYRMRIDGVLSACEGQCYFSIMQHQILISRIKALAKLDIAQNRLAQDGRISWKNCDIRVAIHPTQFGEKVVLRLFYPQQYRQLHQLNLSPEITEKLHHIIHQPQGLILFTGPTGSGKTSLMYSLLGELNRLEQNIMTIEEPVEYRLPYLQQTNLSENSQMTWESSLKSLLRQDPDTVILGELRDEKTAKLALQACLTGHRIWTTVHSNSAIATFARFEEWDIKPMRLSAGVTAVIQQRLIKKKHGKGRELILEILDNTDQQLTNHLAMGKHWFDFKPFLTLHEHAQKRLLHDEILEHEVTRILGYI